MDSKTCTVAQWRRRWLLNAVCSDKRFELCAQQDETSKLLMETSFTVVEKIWPNERRSVETKRFVVRSLLGAGPTFGAVVLALNYLFRVRDLLAGQCPLHMWVVALGLAWKVSADGALTYSQWAQVTGLEPSALSAAEMRLLNLLKFDVILPQQTFISWAQYIVLCLQHVQTSRAGANGVPLSAVSAPPATVASTQGYPMTPPPDFMLPSSPMAASLPPLVEVAAAAAVPLQLVKRRSIAVLDETSDSDSDDDVVQVRQRHRRIRTL